MPWPMKMTSAIAVMAGASDSELTKALRRRERIIVHNVCTSHGGHFNVSKGLSIRRIALTFAAALPDYE